MGSYERRPSMSDYTELVKALRCCANLNTNCTVCPWDKYNFALCAEKLYTDAAAAIEALEAQLPKRGEWIVNGANRIDCSVCGHSICFASVLSKGSLTGYNYCPRCGAKMTGEQNVE